MQAPPGQAEGPSPVLGLIGKRTGDGRAPHRQTPQSAVLSLAYPPRMPASRYATVPAVVLPPDHVAQYLR